MLGPVVEEAIEGLAGDRTSSASRLARVALETMALATLEGPAWRDPKFLAEAARRISEAQPAMAIVHNVVHLYARLVAEGQEPMAVLREIHGELETARERIGKTFLKVAPDHATVLTLSFSEGVRACLLAANGKRRVEQVFVMEAGPVFEGRSMAKVLTEDGVTATVITDDLGPDMAADATYVLVGADSILRDGSVVNKRGTQPLAKAAAGLRKPVFVACETMKFDARFDAATWPRTRQADLFDVTPANLVTSIVTERGSYTPDTVVTLLSPQRASGDRR
ncbi:MAG TPA: hypothetical protein VFA17_01925 [Thermoplasmata archaeon]|jgi:translation initiation factor eIF-2B subunit delta|nr:hypothetical protein [Thermoplasmata archaeon]